MRIKTIFFDIEIEWLLILVILISIFSNTVRNFLTFYYICYLFIIFHELAHINIGILFNKEIEKVKFSFSGACAVFKRENKSVNKLEVLVYLAGPLSNLLLAYIFRDNRFIFEINLLLAMINFVPIKPLDGYNILNELLKNFFDNYYKRENIYNKISIIFLCIITILSFIQLIYQKNPSILIFIVYLIILNLTQKSSINIERIINKISS
ncbi:MAG: hypothetical protein N2749_05930 [Clostridia bacterium]|nr:hypothetical protein [Clostridia bacterium]